MLARHETGSEKREGDGSPGRKDATRDDPCRQVVQDQSREQEGRHDRCRSREVVADHRNAPVNALGYLRVMFAVDDIDETLARLSKYGAELVSSEVVQYKDAYRLCYIRGPEGLLIGLAQELG